MVYCCLVPLGLSSATKRSVAKQIKKLGKKRFFLNEFAIFAKN